MAFTPVADPGKIERETEQLINTKATQEDDSESNRHISCLYPVTVIQNEMSTLLSLSKTAVPHLQTQPILIQYVFHLQRLRPQTELLSQPGALLPACQHPAGCLLGFMAHCDFLTKHS